jgi:hypothetical protein
MKKLKNIMLHMGPDKTGSTAIQKTLSSNAAYFEKIGILFAADLGHKDRLLPIAFCETQARIKQLFNTNKEWGGAKAYLSVLQKRVETTAADTLILSHEGLVHLNETELKELSSFLQSMAEQVHVVLYARSPVSYAISAMSQRVKTGRRAYLKGLPPVFQYRDVCERIISVFGRENVDMRLFDSKVFPSGDVVMDFLSVSMLKPQHIDTKSLVRTFDVNSGFSGAGVQVGDRIVEILGAQVPSEKRFTELFFKDLHQLKGQKLTLSPKRLRAIRRLSKSHTEFLEQEFNIIFTWDTFNQSNDFVGSQKSSEVERIARDLIARRLPDYQLSWFQGVCRRLLCLREDVLSRFN